MKPEPTDGTHDSADSGPNNPRVCIFFIRHRIW